jgi:hypothetical protein
MNHFIEWTLYDIKGELELDGYNSHLYNMIITFGMEINGSILLELY